MPNSCSQFARRAAVLLLPIQVMLMMAVSTPADAQKPKTSALSAARAANGNYSDGGSLAVGVNTTFGVSVTPDNQSQVVSPGATLTFRVTNTGTATDNYSITANCTPTCSVSPLTLSSVSPGASMGRNVTVSLGTFFGTVVVTATGSGGAQDNGSIIPSAPTYTVSVGPDGTPDYWYEAGQAGTANFTVSNSGNSTATYSLSGSCDAVATGCSAPPASVTVGAGGSTSVPITFTAGTAGSAGYVRLNAGGPSSDGGTVHVLVYSHTVSVAAPAPVTVNPGSYSASFNVTNTGNVQTVYNLSSTCGGQITGCPASLGQVSVAAGATVPVSVAYTVANYDNTGSVTLTASYTGNGSVNGSAAMSVTATASTHTVSVAAPAAVSVDPGSYSASFNVTNTGNVANTYNLSSTCGGQITGCSASLGQITVGVGATTAVSVPYTAVNRGDAGTVTLTASYAGNSAINGSAAMSVSVKHSYAVAVTPDNQGQIVSPSGSVTFYVQNLGSIQTSFSVSVNCGVCTLSASTITVNPGTANGVNVVVSLNGYVGTVILTASDAAHGTSDTGSIIVTAPTYTVGVGPDGTPDFWYEAGQAGIANFTVSNSGNSTATYSLAGSCDAVVTGCSAPTPASVTVGPGASARDSITFTAGAAGSSGYVRLNASGPSSDGGTVHVIVYNHAVSVAKGGTATVYAAPGLSLQIGVTNTGNVSNSYNLTLTCSGAVSACGANPSISNLGVGLTQQVTVTYNAANNGGTGSVKLVAKSTVNAAIADSGTVTVTVKPKYTVAVTPDAGTAQADAWTTASIPFVVANNGTGPSGHYALSITSCTGSAPRGSCTLDSTTVLIPQGGTSQVKVSFLAGTATQTANIGILATSVEDPTFSDAGSAQLTVTKYAVSVTPDTLAVAPSAYANYSQNFVVTNGGNTPRTFSLQVTCAPPSITSCSSPTNLVTLPSSGTATVSVSYTTGDPSTTGTLRFIATDTLGKSADAGSLAVTVGTGVANNQVQFKNINPGTTIERSQCLVFAIVSDVADECGALRIVHPLPAVRTLGKVRVPTLIYSSDQLQGPTLAVNVILADTTTIPDSVQLTVVRTWPDAHKDTLTRRYPGAAWQSPPQTNRRRRIAIPNVANGGIGILRYSVSVSLLYSGTLKLAASVDSSELAYVDRSNSAFGAGWWLAGLEQLSFGQSDGSVLWVGGDGSTRKYVRQGVSGTDTVYLAPAFNRPDTLLHRSDSTYRRQVGNGLFVEFDRNGYHKRTVNRLGYETDFTYDPNHHLSSLQLPPRKTTNPAFTYSFTFNPTAQLLDAVTAPNLSGKLRKVLLTRSATLPKVVQTITEQLDTSTYLVSFGLGNGSQYAWRSDRRGVKTMFQYEASSPTIASFATAIVAGGTDSVRHTFRTATAMGAVPGTSARLDTVYFRYDGPRPLAVGDTTLFWVDRFGGPVRIVDAMGHETVITRGDQRFPGLATEVRGPAPNKFTTWASYDDRGNLRASTQVNPHADTNDATTTYLWDPKWDMVTRITQPEGEVTNIGYDANGNRLYQEDGRGLMSRVNFSYYAPNDVTTGAMAGLLSTIVLPSTATLGIGYSTVKYDSLGNVNTTTTAFGTMTVNTNDSVGRTVAIRNQISFAGDTTSTRLTYDLSDRVIRTVTYAPPLSGSPAHTITVDNTYDQEGRVLSVARSQSPDTSRTFNLTDPYPALGALISRYSYDDLGRKVAEIAPDSTPAVNSDNPVDSTFYDFAGNVDSVHTRRYDHVPAADTAHHVIKMTYDALNRLKTRTVPSARYRARVDGLALADLSIQDTASKGYNTPYPRFPNNTYTATNPQSNYPNWGGYTVSGYTATYDYDAAGNMTVADNADARVRRQYYPNGQVRRDSLYTKTLLRDTEHMYGIEYLYDRDGRPTTLKHPTQLSGGSTGYQNTMQYDSVTGALSTVVDPLGNSFTYGYDARSQVTSLTMPNGVSERYDYDEDGNMVSQWAGASPSNTPFPGTIHSVTMAYDARGKMVTLWNAVAAKDTISDSYSGLGYLVHADHTSWLKGDTLTRYRTTENFTFDPLGNRLHSDFADSTWKKTGNCGGPFATCFSQTTTDGDLSDWYYRIGTGRLVFDNRLKNHHQDQTKFDEAGNIVFSTQKQATGPTVYEDRASYYGADGVLAAVDYRQNSQNNQFWHTIFDEYRYDALGRRVLVRSQRRCGTESNDCHESYVRRTVWAGAQELYEIQMPDTATARENDTAAVAPKPLGYLNYDPNPLYGRVAYTIGLRIDQPLSVTRLRFMNAYSEVWAPFSIVPLWTTRGTADTSYFAATGKNNCNTNNRCVLVSYPDPYWTPSWSQYFAPATFQGTLLTDKSDHTGQLFRRNRYYDPQTGRFTQEDPIGLAGGINVYGFGAGDPVNFSDPFGLAPWDDPALGYLVIRFLATVATAHPNLIEPVTEATRVVSEAVKGIAEIEKDLEKSTKVVIKEMNNAATKSQQAIWTGAKRAPVKPLGATALKVGGAILGIAGSIALTPETADRCASTVCKKKPDNKQDNQ